MKADLAPKYSKPLNSDTVILWFELSNRYILIDNNLHLLLRLFLNANDQNSFIESLKESLNIEDSKCKNIFNEISFFLDNANITLDEAPNFDVPSKTPKSTIEKSYRFNELIVQINYESSTIQSLIHPQIAHHTSDKQTHSDITFDIFRTKDFLHLFKNDIHKGSFNTSNFHFLQGKFALELTNAIHHKAFESWIATFHASTICDANEAIMIIGDSGNGKSTLSTLLMTSGLDLLADDFTPLNSDFKLYRYPSAISVKKGAFEALESKVKDFKSLQTHTNGPKKVNIKYIPPSTNFEKNTHAFTCNKIVHVKFDASVESSLTEVPLTTILETLIPDSWISPNTTHALQFIDWLKQIKCYDLTYSDNAFAISNFKALFGQ
ncbi:hypothetical protein [Psychroserpens sp. MEBiC05023]